MREEMKNPLAECLKAKCISGFILFRFLKGTCHRPDVTWEATRREHGEDNSH
jgi:hypothetical protein